MTDAVHMIDRVIAETAKEDLVLFDWQFKLSTRLCQIMEASNMTPSEFARMVNITDEQLDELLHFCSDPPLSLLAQIEALSKSNLLTWANTDVSTSEQRFPSSRNLVRENGNP